MSWFPCCCPSVTPCPDFCIDDEAPSHYKVVLAGFANGDCDSSGCDCVTFNCGDCTDINGTYILQQVTADPCLYYLDTPEPSICSHSQAFPKIGFSISVRIEDELIRVTLLFSGNPGCSTIPSNHEFTNAYTGAIDCNRLADEEIDTHSSTDAECDATGATCHITAV